MAAENSCMLGIHVWDITYETQVTSERYCLACGHFFAADDTEDNAADDSIVWKTGSLLTKPANHTKAPATGLNKGLIKRRG